MRPLILNSLSVTLPDDFIHESQRNEFHEIVRRCGVAERLPDNYPPSSGRGLKLMYYNQLTSALNDGNLLQRLRTDSWLYNCWFFNVFIIMDNYDGQPFKDGGLFTLKGSSDGLNKFPDILTKLD